MKTLVDILHMLSSASLQKKENNCCHVRKFQEDFHSFTFFKNYLQSGWFEMIPSHRSILLFFSDLRDTWPLYGMKKCT